MPLIKQTPQRYEVNSIMSLIHLNIIQKSIQNWCKISLNNSNNQINQILNMI